ncbi:chemotaxis protein CheW [Pelagicoccus sp. SDUM812003]|uniref:chemotaxis protein CheV n=1 Tax=Pelagicoccus sp. SDUM812003 TaxID=3041267 RepID=UPI00280C8EA0|nr:chemotaxis protein CheW [Pelagicoccus sp. SDUM812003]MDQ8201686.1 chemotaxis protein CheW [Pelagicoccus sp. SDUM812003]
MNAPATSRDAILLESGTNEVEFIEFFLGDISYGINVSKVQRVLSRASVEVTKVAQAPHATLGMIHIHQKPVMLMDLKAALGVPYDENAVNPDRQLILVTTFNKQTTAFLIDGISKIHRTSWEDFEPLGEKVNGESAGGFSTGTVTLDDNIIIILDLERLMLTYFPSAHRPVKPLDPLEGPLEGRDSVRILYAEDSKMVRNITTDIVRNAGYLQIDAFENGLEAFRHLSMMIEAQDDPSECPYDLVLTDIEMPQMDGLTLCRRIKAELCKKDPPKVIVYSSLINKEMSAKCASVGADAQLAKPDVEQIVALIDQICLKAASA